MAMTKLVKSSLIMLVILGFTLLFVSTGFPQTANQPAQRAPDYKELRMFRQIMRIVQNNYVREVSDKELIQGAISGLLESLDPHSSYLTEEMFQELQTETKGEFAGLGFEITLDGGVLTIVSPIEDTPASKAGLRPGDKIIKINGESTKNITLIKAVKLMRGREGTKVTVTVMRDGWRKFKDFTLTRRVIHVHSVKRDLVEPGYAYVRIVNFQDTTDSDLVRSSNEMGGNERIKGLILDLRNNPGGLLDQAVKVSQLFVDRGLIMYTDGRAKDQRMEFKANSSGRHYKFKMAVLINQGSASASEIVAAALQDHDRALVFGTKSFGKASVQTIIPMENGAGLRLTTAYYYSPKGRHIQKTGIHPDVLESSEPLSDLSTTRNQVDVRTAPVIRDALNWLKSTQTVKESKDDKVDSTQVRAEQGDTEAQFELGLLYFNGRRGRQDLGKAAEWVRKAAEQGHARAQFHLGKMFDNGKGVRKDDSQAAYWYRKAAEQGIAAAQNNLGVNYNRGEGVPKDFSEAVRWYRKAAEQGLAVAQYNLGVMYERGEGVAKDSSEALRWYRKAEAQGYAKAKQKVAALTTSSTTTNSSQSNPGGPHEWAKTSSDFCTSARYLLETLERGIIKDEDAGLIKSDHIGKDLFPESEVTTRWQGDMTKIAELSPYTDYSKKVRTVGDAIFEAAQKVRKCIQLEQENKKPRMI